MEVDARSDHQNSSSVSSGAPSPPPTPSRKRSLDSLLGDNATAEDDDAENSRNPKKSKRVPVDGDRLADDLALELQCGCCAGLCYNPVVVQPCQHFFCGSCCVLWVNNGGTNCPACRSASSNVTTSRILATMLNTLLRADPSRQRESGERSQADQIYRPGDSIRIPVPKAPSPEPTVRDPDNDMYARPCPHCLSNNPYHWRCPVPIVDPSVDRGRAFNLEDGVPEGHAFCGNCDLLHAFGAPTSSKCDFCLASFCGITVEDRCRAVRAASQRPHSIASIGDLLESGELYDIFNQNTIEVDRLLDYMREEGVDIVGDVYTEIIRHLAHQPEPFKALFDSGLFEAHVPPLGSSNQPTTTPVAPATTTTENPSALSDSESNSDSGSEDGDHPAPPALLQSSTTNEATAPLLTQSGEGISQPSPDAQASDQPTDVSQTRSNTPPPPPVPVPAPPPPPAALAARKKICRTCACEVFFWGLKEWWIRERERVLNTANKNAGGASGAMSGSHATSGSEAIVNTSAGGEEEVETTAVGEDVEKPAEPSGILALLRSLKECEDGSDCLKQGDMTHARAFSHILPVARLQRTSNEGSTITSGMQGGNQDAGTSSNTIITTDAAPTDAPTDVIVSPPVEPIAITEGGVTMMEIDGLPAVPLSDVIVEGFLAERDGEGIEGLAALTSGTPLMTIPVAQTASTATASTEKHDQVLAAMVFTTTTT